MSYIQTNPTQQPISQDGTSEKTKSPTTPDCKILGHTSSGLASGRLSEIYPIIGYVERLKNQEG
ncbi:MAG: hypothetical protein N3E37_06135, partial [Candidatus Micrarchaeota archaeon]|nr:hypothetical protein [Candidatus Micrarchaeota archaeon]